MSEAVWAVLGETELLRCGSRLTVSQQHVRLPDGSEVTEYLRIATQPFVCIFARTEAGEVICERQYKHGAGQVILTLPAGAIEAGEAPLAAAQRELLEETGFASENWTALPTAITHANAGGSRIHMFLAQGCRQVAEPASGDLERMVIERLPLSVVLQAMAVGEMPLSSDPATVMHALNALGVFERQTP